MNRKTRSKTDRCSNCLFWAAVECNVLALRSKSINVSGITGNMELMKLQVIHV